MGPVKYGADTVLRRKQDGPGRARKGTSYLRINEYRPSALRLVFPGRGRLGPDLLDR